MIDINTLEDSLYYAGFKLLKLKDYEQQEDATHKIYIRGKKEFNLLLKILSGNINDLNVSYEQEFKLNRYCGYVYINYK